MSANQGAPAGLTSGSPHGPHGVHGGGYQGGYGGDPGQPSHGGPVGFGGATYGGPSSPPAFVPLPRPRTPEQIEDAGHATLFAVAALFCFAPLAFYSLRLASRAEQHAIREGIRVPSHVRTARLISYIAITLWLVGLFIRLAYRVHP